MGRYRLVRGEAAAAEALALRALVFRGGADDRDRHDESASALAVMEGLRAVAACRLTVTADLATSYAAQFHDLSPLAALGLPAVEVGRLCARPGAADADALRGLMAGIASVAVTAGAGFLFGVTSLAGSAPARHAGALAALAARRGPCGVATHAPGAVALGGGAPDPAALPPTLRAYLAMGAWIAGRAVPDPDLNTLHVLTVLPVAAIPPARRRLLLALAGDLLGG